MRGISVKKGRMVYSHLSPFSLPTLRASKRKGKKILVEDDTHVNIRNTVVRADVLCCRQIASRERQPGENTRKWLQMCQRTWCNSSYRGPSNSRIGRLWWGTLFSDQILLDQEKVKRGIPGFCSHNQLAKERVKLLSGAMASTLLLWAILAATVERGFRVFTLSWYL